MDDPNETSTKCIKATCDKILNPSALTCSPFCKFDGLNCVKQLKTCEDYTSNCDKMISSNSKPCVTNPTDSNKCMIKLCITAPNNLDKNEDCHLYL